MDKAVRLSCVGGMVGEPQKPTDFICLVLKMLQIQPDKEIVIEFIKNDDYKYVRLLGEAPTLPAAGGAVCHPLVPLPPPSCSPTTVCTCTQHT